MELFIEIRTVYGREMFYPDCQNSRLLSEIAGTTTLTPHCLVLARKMGYTVHMHHPTSDVVAAVTDKAAIIAALPDKPSWERT